MAERKGISPAIWKSLAMLGLGLGTVFVCLKSPATVLGDDAGVSLELPDRVLHMSGREGEVSEAEKTILPPDTEIVKMLYHGVSAADTEDVVTCTIVLSANDRRSLHRPQVCLPGQGFTIDSTEIVPIEMQSGEILKVMRLGLSREQEVAKDKKVKLRWYYLYWYVGKDVTTPKTLNRMMITAVDNVFRNVNHRWAYVSVMSMITEGLDPNGKRGRGPAETQLLLEDFIRESVPVFQKTF